MILLLHMQKALKGCRLIVGFLLFIGVLGPLNKHASAEPPHRETTIVVAYNEYEWWLSSWEDNSVLCHVYVDHEGLPSSDEVLQNCGSSIHVVWESTPPCASIIKDNKSDPSLCTGVYLVFIASQPKQKDVVIQLPPAKVYISLDGCIPSQPENRCDTLPSLLFQGEEPLPNETITAIHGTIGGLPFECSTMTCTVPLQATPIEGIPVEFWADSSFGDSSEHFTAMVRVIDSGVSESPGSGGWFVDVLSSQWLGKPPVSCSMTWNAFPPIGGLPGWLSTPDSNVLMASDQAYYYLAGRLIAQGIVNARDCPSGGMLPNGYADACGLEKARPAVESWQNQFDAAILQVASDTEVPAQLMKNLFAQESQFWPGIFKVSYEYGLGQITDMGTDSVLLWNPDFYAQFCPLVLSQEACDQGYLHLTSSDQSILRGALAVQAKVDCPDCQAGIDLTNVNFSLTLFANTIKASCDQVAQIVYNATKESPGAVLSYEDLWRLTIANYHAGPGCVSYAVYNTWASSGILNWAEISNRFTDTCKGVIPYVEKITQ